MFKFGQSRFSRCHFRVGWGRPGIRSSPCLYSVKKLEVEPGYQMLAWYYSERHQIWFLIRRDSESLVVCGKCSVVHAGPGVTSLSPVAFARIDCSCDVPFCVADSVALTRFRFLTVHLFCVPCFARGPRYPTFIGLALRNACSSLLGEGGGRGTAGLMPVTRPTLCGDFHFEWVPVCRIHS